MTPQEFIAKWKRSKLSERSASQQHFLDLCELLGQEKPAAADPDGTEYTFERGVSKTGGGKGWADVWKRHYFAWEYKGKHKDLVDAYNQLARYREDLENPWLLIVCDMDRFEVHTNFPNTVKTVHAFDLDSLAEPKNLLVLRKVFTDPASLEPKITPRDITEEVAKRFATLADGMRDRHIPAERAAHFLMKLMFCMFADWIGLLDGKLFGKILASVRINPAKLSQRLHSLFEAMRKGGDFGADIIRHFNGGLFDDAEVFELTLDEIEELIAANNCDWSNVEPTIFGTLFERTLDPDKRSQIGAHFTGKEDILTVLEPVLMAPLRREWEQVKADADKAFAKVQEATIESVRTARPTKRKPKEKKDSPQRKVFNKILMGFLDRLAHVKVLDPSCGSGNFLYMSIKLLLDLEKEVITYASNRGITFYPHVEPTQLLGIEINPYAQQLAHVAIWIGYLQWLIQNGFGASEPILKPFENIKRMDAIIELTDPANPKEPEWPDAEFIVGNPPFLGNKFLRLQLGDDYADSVFRLYANSIPNGSDLCCYWFEKARRQIEKQHCSRAGLLATQGIRGGLNREALKRIKASGDIFFAESDRPWILQGASVHVSMIGFDNGTEKHRILDSKVVSSINANLTSLADVTSVERLTENVGIAYIGTTKKAPLDISDDQAKDLLCKPNPTGIPNSDVIFPYANGMSITRRMGTDWIIDFEERALAEAALFENPCEHVKTTVYPLRKDHREPRQAEKWWLLARSCPEMQTAIRSLNRYLVTPTVCKYRVFAWLTSPTEPDHQLYVFARNDDFFFGVMHSRLHELWGLRLGTRLETRPRYTPTTCFETFPFPETTDAERDAIAQGAKELDRLRTNWLNPPEWTKQEILEFPGSTTGPWARYVSGTDARGIGTVRYPRLVPKDDNAAADLKKRTLTNLYNQRPTWLAMAHKKLDDAVFAAYAWDPSMSDEDILAKLLELNLQRAKL